MTVWMVRAGDEGQQEQEALNGNFVTMHWQEFDDLSAIQDREALKKLYSKKSPDANTNQVANGAGQVWNFYKEIELGDLAVLPLHDPERPKVKPPRISIGEVTGPYCYRTDMGEEITHTRRVRWIGKPIPAGTFQKDLLRSLGCPPTVYSIGAEDAEARIRAILATGVDPGPDEGDDLDALGAAADEGEDAAIDRLTELAEAAGLDINDYPDSWTSLAEALKSTGEGDATGEDLAALGEAADGGDESAIDRLTELAGEASLDPDAYPSWAELATVLTEPVVNGGLLGTVLEAVRKRIVDFKAKGMALNEATTQAALINPVIAALGWDLEDPEQVVGQFNTGGANRVDNAFFVEEHKNPILLVEAKALVEQKLDGFAHQIMGYAGTSGAAWVVLTNGDEYRVYYAGGTDLNIEQRLFRKVCLTAPNSTVADVAETLTLLSRERIGDLQGMWDKERDDRQVRATVESLFCPEPHPVLLNFVKKGVAGLTATQIKASLARICATIKIP